MLTPEQVALYAPQNAKNLTQDQLAAMAGFKREDLKQLAAVYPNGIHTYLILKDTTKADNKQVFPLSTWKNLYELFKVGQTQFVALTFRSIFNKKDHSMKVAPVQDLTNKEAKDELKMSAEQGAKETGEQGGLKEAAQQDATQTGEGNTNKEAKDKKPLEKMNKKELLAKYLELFGDEAPEELATNRQLIVAIKEKEVSK